MAGPGGSPLGTKTPICFCICRLPIHNTPRLAGKPQKQICLTDLPRLLRESCHITSPVVSCAVAARTLIRRMIRHARRRLDKIGVVAGRPSAALLECFGSTTTGRRCAAAGKKLHSHTVPGRNQRFAVRDWREFTSGGRPAAGEANRF